MQVDSSPYKHTIESPIFFFFLTQMKQNFIVEEQMNQHFQSMLHVHNAGAKSALQNRSNPEHPKGNRLKQPPVS